MRLGEDQWWLIYTHVYNSYTPGSHAHVYAHAYTHAYAHVYTQRQKAEDDERKMREAEKAAVLSCLVTVGLLCCYTLHCRIAATLGRALG